MKRVLAIYLTRNKALVYTGKQLYSFPLKNSFWARLSEVPHSVFKKLTDEMFGLTNNFSAEKEQEDLCIVAVHYPFFSLFFFFSLEDRIPPQYSFTLPICGSFIFYLLKKSENENGTGVAVHTEHGMVTFLDFSDGVPNGLGLSSLKHSARPFSELISELRDPVIILSGEGNPFVEEIVNNEKLRKVRISEEEILKGLYFIPLAHLYGGKDGEK